MMIPASQILLLEARRNQALVDGDHQLLDELYADGCVWVHSSGRRDDKASLMQLVGGAIRFLAIEPSDVTVQVHDGAAVAAGVVRIEAEIGGAPRRMYNRFCVVWAREDASWRVIHWQSTAIADH